MEEIEKRCQQLVLRVSIEDKSVSLCQGWGNDIDDYRLQIDIEGSQIDMLIKWLQEAKEEMK